MNKKKSKKKIPFENTLDLWVGEIGIFVVFVRVNELTYTFVYK